MPRRSKELTLTSQEIAELSKIESGPDQEQALRARIILACAQENQNKLVAQKLGTSETNVRNWKEAYRRSGIEAILRSLPSGRPLSENKPANLPNLISSFIEKRPDSWTASAIAKELNITVSDVYHTLRKLGIIPKERRRSWTYRTEEIMDNGFCHLAGVYLTPAAQILVVAERDRMFSGHSMYGEITTKNSALYSQLSKSAEPLSAADCVVSFTQQTSYICRGKRKSPEEFLSESLKLRSEPFIRKLDVFIFSEGAVKHADSSPDIAFYETHSLPDFAGSFAVWRVKNFPDEDLLQKRVYAFIFRYAEACREEMEPIIWRYTGISEKPAEQNQEFLGVEFTFRAEDGRVIKKRIMSDMALPAAGECDFSSLEDFEKSMNRIDDAMTAMSEKVKEEGRKMVRQAIKKDPPSDPPGKHSEHN